ERNALMAGMIGDAPCRAAARSHNSDGEHAEATDLERHLGQDRGQPHHKVMFFRNTGPVCVGCERYSARFTPRKISSTHGCRTLIARSILFLPTFASAA